MKFSLSLALVLLIDGVVIRIYFRDEGMRLVWRAWTEGFVVRGFGYEIDFVEEDVADVRIKVFLCLGWEGGKGELYLVLGRGIGRVRN